ncbi:MAG: hypothetical protein LBJ67_06120 [Planctomycetaceae bacterium]|nr:hypothetical protein [Planctomycetaceae bacterium]
MQSQQHEDATTRRDCLREKHTAYAGVVQSGCRYNNAELSIAIELF